MGQRLGKTAFTNAGQTTQQQRVWKRVTTVQGSDLLPLRKLPRQTGGKGCFTLIHRILIVGGAKHFTVQNSGSDSGNNLAQYLRQLHLHLSQRLTGIKYTVAVIIVFGHG